MAVTPTPGPFAAWCTAADLCCGPPASFVDLDPNAAPDPAPVAALTQDEAINAASRMLYLATGSRWPGTVTRTVSISPRFRRGTRIDLCSPWPVTAITAVTHNALVVTATDYELHDWGILVRRPDATGFRERWTGPVVVTYTTGRAVPVHGKLAAAKLACALRGWCVNAPTLSERGISLSQEALAKSLESRRIGRGRAMDSHRTGIVDVDVFLQSYGLETPHVVMWSPGMRDDDPVVVSWP